MAVTIRNLYSTKTTKYVFHLEPVPEERIYILESKVRDLQDEVEKLRGIDASPPFVKLTTLKKDGSLDLCW